MHLVKILYTTAHVGDSLV